jgi:ubiquinone/menaquinone biosynthesis C-methylase UbiE
MTNYSDFIAKIYDPLLYPALKQVRKAVMNKLLKYKNEPILDLCCGTGDQLKLLSKNGFRNLHCLDLSDSMLNIARKGNYPINIYIKDATKTGLKTESFNVIIISFAIHEKDRITQEAMLNEAHRIMKKNGLLLIVDFILDERTMFASRLGITLIERLAGKEHYRNFRNYIKNNGLSSLLNPDKFKYIKSERKLFNGLAISLYQKSL